MREIKEEEAIQLAEKPHLIADAETCNTVIAFLNAFIGDLAQAEWELEVATNNHHEILLHQENKTVALKEAEYKNSEPYKKWREMGLKVRRYRAYRNSLKSKEETLKFKPKYENRAYLG